MKSIELVNSLVTTDCNGMSHSDLADLNMRNFLKPYLDSKNIGNLLREDINNYFNTLYNYYNEFHYYKELCLENLLQPTCLYTTDYMICLYCDAEEFYRENHKLIKKAIDKLDIRNYQMLTEESIKTNLKAFHLTNEESYNQTEKKSIFEIKTRYLPKKEYTTLRNHFNINYIHPDYQNNWYIWYEQCAFNKELYDLAGKWTPLFVARDCGDGYGYDILSYNPITNQEQLIEVKARTSESFSLTENEYNVMINCHIYNAEYYVYKYLHSNNTPPNSKPKILRYDYLNRILVDIETNEYYELIRVARANNKSEYAVIYKGIINTNPFQYIKK